MKEDIVCVSGGFDPLHKGHLALFRDAAKKGRLCVIINSDRWLMRKKGFVFLPWQQRAMVIGDLRYVATTEPVDDSDDTVCEALRRIRPRYFANGGDRKNDNTPEIALCHELGIELLWGMGGDKSESSADIARRAWVERQWGRYVTLDERDNYKVKKLIIDPGQSISLQYHNHRDEAWYVAEGIAQIRLGDLTSKVVEGPNPVIVEKKKIHQLTNAEMRPLIIIEIQSGISVKEDDIIRLESACQEPLPVKI